MSASPLPDDRDQEDHGGLCLACCERPGSYRRLLCRSCYDDPDIREQYPRVRSRGGVLEELDTYAPAPFPLPDQPTDAPPGSEAKIRVMCARLWNPAGTRHLHHPDDVPIDAESGPRGDGLFCQSVPERDAIDWDADDQEDEDDFWVVPRRWASLITHYPVRPYPERLPPLEPLKVRPAMSTITSTATPTAATVAVPGSVVTIPAAEVPTRPTVADPPTPSPKKRPGPPRKYTDEERRARKAAYRRAQYQRQKQQAAAGQAAQQAPAATAPMKVKGVAIAVPASPTRALPAREQGVLLALVRRHGLAAVRRVLDDAEAEARRMLGLN